jgi:hypothetical protein
LNESDSLLFCLFPRPLCQCFIACSYVNRLTLLIFTHFF